MKMKIKENSLSMFISFCTNSLNAHDVDPAVEYTNYIVDRMELSDDQVIWLCFLYGLTYQLPTAWVLFNEMPDLNLVNKDRLEKWFSENKYRLPYQNDKIKCRPKTVETILSYQKLVNGSQKKFFDNLLSSEDPQVNFDKLWTPAKSIYCFGRFSTWNFCQMLKHVAGYNIEPTILMLGEPDSVSFTDGLAYSFGLNDKITKKVDIPNTNKKKKVYYKWTDEEKVEMEEQCSTLKGILGIDNFQLETLACAFKKIWRTKDSRYVGYYNDRMSDDINSTSSHSWYGIDWELLWDTRNACVPPGYIHNNLGVNRDNFLLTPEEKINL